jgi:hypothetical protein
LPAHGTIALAARGFPPNAATDFGNQRQQRSPPLPLP